MFIFDIVCMYACMHIYIYIYACAYEPILTPPIVTANASLGAVGPYCFAKISRKLRLVSQLCR